MGWALAPLIVVVAMIAVAVWRGRQFGKLARHGINVPGIVVRKFRSGSADGELSRGRRIAFTYRGPDGVEYRRAASITLGKWRELNEGDPIEVICLPDRPGISAPAWLIILAREALTKKAGK